MDLPAEPDLEQALRDLQSAVDCGLIVRSAIDLYLALTTLSDSMLLDITAYHELGRIDYTVMPMFRAEVNKQKEDLMLLGSVGNVTCDVVLTLRTCGFVGVQPVIRFGL